MSLKSDVIANTVSGLVESVPAGIRSIRNTFSKKLTPDEQAAFDSEMAAIEERLTTAQTEINKVEAGSSRLFVAGWRPYLGWVLGTAVALFFIPQYAFGSYLWLKDCIAADHLLPYPLSIKEVIGLLGGLGLLGGFRTIEKIKGVQDKH